MTYVTVKRSQRRMFALLIHKTFPSKPSNFYGQY